MIKKDKEINKLRKNSIGTLMDIVRQKRLERSLIYAKMKAGKEPNPKKLRSLKLDIARILTIIRQKEISDRENKKNDTNLVKTKKTIKD